MLKIIMLVIGCSILGAIGQLLFGKAMHNFEFNAIITNYTLYIGLLAYFIALIGYLFALRHGEVSVLYPIISLSYIWVIIGASIFLHEALTFNKVIGGLAIIMGVFLIAR